MKYDNPAMVGAANYAVGTQQGLQKSGERAGKYAQGVMDRREEKERFEQTRQDRLDIEQGRIGQRNAESEQRRRDQMIGENREGFLASLTVPDHANVNQKRELGELDRDIRNLYSNNWDPNDPAVQEKQKVFLDKRNAIISAIGDGPDINKRFRWENPQTGLLDPTYHEGARKFLLDGKGEPQLFSEPESQNPMREFLNDDKGWKETAGRMLSQRQAALPEGTDPSEAVDPTEDEIREERQKEFAAIQERRARNNALTAPIVHAPQPVNAPTDYGLEPNPAANTVTRQQLPANQPATPQQAPAAPAQAPVTPQAVQQPAVMFPAMQSSRGAKGKSPGKTKQLRLEYDGLSQKALSNPGQMTEAQLERMIELEEKLKDR